MLAPGMILLLIDQICTMLLGFWDDLSAGRTYFNNLGRTLGLVPYSALFVKFPQKYPAVPTFLSFNACCYPPEDLPILVSP